MCQHRPYWFRNGGREPCEACQQEQQMFELSQQHYDHSGETYFIVACFALGAILAVADELWGPW